MIIAVSFITGALALYSLAIWSERFSRALKPWMIIVFACAFICDLSGTSLMFLRATEKFQLQIHSLSGYLALIIMGGHLIWAIRSFKRSGKAAEKFHRFSFLAWIAWLIAFISGIPKM